MLLQILCHITAALFGLLLIACWWRSRRALHQVAHERDQARLLAAETARQASADAALRNEFVATVTHELRTPLNGIIGMTSLLRSGDLDPRQREYADIIRASAKTLAVLVNDLLDFARIESRHIALEHIPFSLPDIIHDLHVLFAPRATAKGLDLALDIDPHTPAQVNGDPHRVRQILNNLLDNAIKFTEQGEIRIACGPASDGPDRRPIMRLVISDTGPGIAAEMQDRIFDPFCQNDASITRRHGGTGLGLAICRRLSVLMGGSLELSSSDDTGSTFTCLLPLEVAQTTHPDDAQRQDRVTTQMINGCRVHLLLVEDNPVNRRTIQLMLEHLGYQVDCADNGSQALTLLTGQHYHGVIMDCIMPEMDGFATARAIRTGHAGDFDPHLPIIALSAHTLTADRDRALEAGMNAYLTKPVQASELAKVLDGLLAAHYRCDMINSDTENHARERSKEPS